MSNVSVYMAIAEESLAESQRSEAEARSPKSNGESGHVIKWVPRRASFKHSLISIAFSGMYLEALLYLTGVDRLGKSQYMKIDHKKYEEKLSALGITDALLLAECKRFRVARNDLTHEKAIEPRELGSTVVRMAQQEAAMAVAFVKSVSVALKNVP